MSAEQTERAYVVEAARRIHSELERAELERRRQRRELELREQGLQPAITDQRVIRRLAHLLHEQTERARRSS